MKVRDFYFAAWVIEKGREYSITKKGLDLNISLSEMKDLQVEYTSTVKPCFDKVKNLIKEINKTKKGLR